MKSFVVGPDDLGTPEALWSSPGGPLDGVGAMDFGPPPFGRRRRIVAVAPHPDDEVLGLGGTLRRFVREGATVDVVAVTDGEAAYGGADIAAAEALGRRRRDEARAAIALLGLGAVTVHHLAVPDGGVGPCAGALTETLTRLVAGADWCLATWRGDGHPDHEAVGHACAAACERAGVRLGEYPVWAWHWARPDSDDLPWAKARAVALDADDRTAKAAAVAAHRSQIEARGPLPAQGPVLPAEMLAHFARPVEVLFV